MRDTLTAADFLNFESHEVMQSLKWNYLISVSKVLFIIVIFIVKMSQTHIYLKTLNLIFT